MIALVSFFSLLHFLLLHPIFGSDFCAVERETQTQSLRRAARSIVLECETALTEADTQTARRRRDRLSLALSLASVLSPACGGPLGKQISWEPRQRIQEMRSRRTKQQQEKKTQRRDREREEEEEKPSSLSACVESVWAAERLASATGKHTHTHMPDRLVLLLFNLLLPRLPYCSLAFPRFSSHVMMADLSWGKAERLVTGGAKKKETDRQAGCCNVCISYHHTLQRVT